MLSRKVVTAWCVIACPALAGAMSAGTIWLAETTNTAIASSATVRVIHVVSPTDGGSIERVAALVVAFARATWRSSSKFAPGSGRPG